MSLCFGHDAKTIGILSSRYYYSPLGDTVRHLQYLIHDFKIIVTFYIALLTGKHHQPSLALSLAMNDCFFVR